jgi:hypothetical protein
MPEKNSVDSPVRKAFVGKLVVIVTALVAVGILCVDRPVRGLEKETGADTSHLTPPPLAQGLHFLLHRVEPPLTDEQKATLKGALAEFRTEILEELPDHFEEASNVRSAIQAILTDEQKKSARRLWFGAHLEGNPHVPGPLGRLAALRGILDRIQPTVSDPQRTAIRDAVDEHVVPHLEMLLARRAATASEFASLVKETLSATQIDSVIELRNRYSAEKHFFDTLLDE